VITHAKTEPPFKDEKETDTLRKSGIEVIDNIPWGTHLCQFYETKEDLINILVPYFAEGLRNNEFCMWVTSEPLSEKEAEKAMGKAVPGFDRYLKRGQIEIVPHTEWYLKDGAFNLHRVLNDWIDKLNQSLAKGYDGIRVTGNTAWLEKRDWRSFSDYEEEVNDVIGKYRMIAICTYSLDKCGASEVIDVVRNHQFALIKRRGMWERIESSELKRVKETLRESEENFRALAENALDGILIAAKKGAHVYANKRAAEITGYSVAELLKTSIKDLAHPDEFEKVMERYQERLEGKPVPRQYETVIIRKDAKSVPIELAATKTVWQGQPANLVFFRDITERKKAEGGLIRLSSAVRMSIDSIVISDLDAKIIDVNEATLKMYGTDDKRDLVGKNSFDLIAPEDREKALAGMKEVLEKGYVKDREYHIITKDGSRIPVEMSTAIMKGADGKPTGFVAVSRDISERKRAEEALKESEEKYRNLFENARDLILTFDLEGNITSVNNVLLKYGYDKSHVVGKNLFHFIPKEYWRQFRDGFTELAHGKPSGGEFKIKSRRRPGYIVAEYRSNPIIQDNKVVGVQTIVRDITERKMLEEKLRQYSEHLEEVVQKRTEELLESEKRYSVLVEEASDGVVIIQDGKIVFTNKRGAEISGYSRDELIGLSLEKLVDEKYRQLAKERYERRLQGERVPTTYEVEFIAKTGEGVPVEASATRINYQGRPADLVIVRDIRERKRLEEERLKLERLAAIGEAAAMVGHDLRNPLQAIVNTLYLVKEKSKSMPVTDKKIVEKHGYPELRSTLMEEVEYMNKIVSDLQDYARPLKPELVPTSIHQLINETLSTITVPENVKTFVEIEGNLDFPKLMVDPAMIRRVFTNLIINALQAMPDGGQLTIRSSKTDEAAFISVQDTGVGIPEEDQPKLFRPLFTTKSKGQGFGLPVCRRLVEAHNGSITVQSEVGKGSIFTVEIPLRREVS